MPDDLGSRPLVLPPPHAPIHVRRNVKYHDDLEADVFSPAEGEKKPAIIFIHGGPVPDGAKPKRMRVFGDYGTLAAASGLTGITFNHRFFGNDIETAANDVTALLEFARVQPEVDPQRLVLWAFSGGGPFLSFGFDRADVRAMIAYYAVLDAPDRRLSPLGHLRSGGKCPPMFIARAAKDHAMLNEIAEHFVQEMLQRNFELDLMTHPEGVHGFDIMNDDERSRAIIRRTIEFVKEHVSPR